MIGAARRFVATPEEKKRAGVDTAGRQEGKVCDPLMRATVRFSRARNIRGAYDDGDKLKPHGRKKESD